MSICSILLLMVVSPSYPALWQALLASSQVTFVGAERKIGTASGGGSGQSHHNLSRCHPHGAFG